MQDRVWMQDAMNENEPSFQATWCVCSQVFTSVPANPEKEKCETSIQKVLSPDKYIKHPLQNK